MRELWEWLGWVLATTDFDQHTDQALNTVNPECACSHPHAMHQHHHARSYCGWCGPNVCQSYRARTQADYDAAFNRIVANRDTGT